MGAAPAALDVVVRNVLGYTREEHRGWTVLLEVEMGGTVHGVCRLVVPTEAVLAGLRNFLAEASVMPTPGVD